MQEKGENSEIRTRLLKADEQDIVDKYKECKGLQPNVFLILPSCIIGSFLGVGIIPIIPTLQLQWFSDYRDAQYYGGIFTSIIAILGFFSSPQIGRISDAYGRKPVLILGSIFSFLTPFSLYITTGSSYVPYYTVLLIGGLFGCGRFSIFTFFIAYVTDCSTKTNRTKELGYVGATAGLGLSLTIFLNHLITIFTMEKYLLLLSILGFVNIFYIALVVPESKIFATDETKGNSTTCIINPLAPLEILKTNKILRLLAIIIFLSQLPEAGVAQIALLYLNEIYVLKGSQIRYFDSLVFSAMGVTSVICQYWVVKLFLKLKLNYSTMILICVGANCVHLLFYGLLALFPMWMFFLNTIPIGLCFLIPTVTNSFLSFHVDEEEIGVALGSIGAINGICGFIGPLLFSQIYSATENGTAFFVGFVIAGISFLITLTKLSQLEKGK